VVEILGRLQDHESGTGGDSGEGEGEVRVLIPVVMIFSLTGCVQRPELPSSGPQDAGLVACVKHHGHHVRDAYIISSEGDPEAVRVLLEQIKYDDFMPTVVSPEPGNGWDLSAGYEKNAKQLPMPESCGPPKTSN